MRIEGFPVMRWHLVRHVPVVALLTAATATFAQDPQVVKTRRALDFLGNAALSWQSTFGCSGCHKQSMTIAALGLARSGGHDDAKPGTVATLIDGMLHFNSGQQADGCFTLNNGPDSTEGTSFGGRGLEAYDRFFSAADRSSLIAAADCLLGRQQADGSLASDHTELPVAQGDFITTTHGVFAFRRTFETTGTASYASASDRAVTWLRGRIATIEASPTGFTTQDKAMLLAGLGTSGAGPADPDVVRARNVLAADQQADGSWKLSGSTGGGNGHATGQAVYALRTVGFDRTDPAVDRGTTWLLANQQADGSWPGSFWQGNPPSKIAPSMWGALALATYRSPLNGVRVDGGGAATISWTAVDGATSYDLIRGDLGSLAELSDRVDLGTVSCLAAGTVSLSTTDATTPAPGTGFYYLMRIRWTGNHDIYGRSTGGRDRIPASGDCAP
jgi:hypothetical protein